MQYNLNKKIIKLEEYVKILNNCVLCNVQYLINNETNTIVSNIEKFIDTLDLEYNNSQKKSWIDSIEYLKNTFNKLDGYRDIYIAFEYVIPMSCYKRPDIVLFFKDKILILEFKRKDIALDVDKQQLRGYLNEIRNYHEESRNLIVNGCLVVTEGKDFIKSENNIDIVCGNTLYEYLKDMNNDFMDKDYVVKWISSKYKPLLNIIEATRDRFINDSIQEIKNIEEGSLKRTQEFVINSIKNNKSNKNIIFLTGVPGAGKTLVLLNTVYYTNDVSNVDTIFTSGNGPLISVLQNLLSKDKDNLDGSSYIKEIKSIKSSMYDKYKDIPKQGVNLFKTICFDEAQRAWDLKHMEKYKFKVCEPELLLKLQNKAYEEYGSVNLICSIGEGQSIYVGEESDFKDTWGNILNKDEYKDWNIYCTKNLSSSFTNRDINKNLFIKDELHIDTSIRANFIDTSKFIEAVLDVNRDKARIEVSKMVDLGYEIKICRDFEKIKSRIKDMKQDNRDNSYGLIASSNSSRRVLNDKINGFRKILSQMDNAYIGKWYVDDCDKLESAASEFACQGLELNYPVVVISGEYKIDNGKWCINNRIIEEAKKGNKDYKKVLDYSNRDSIFRNIYRVLMSRGRNGLILFIPDYRPLDETFKFFRNIGIEEI